MTRNVIRAIFYIAAGLLLSQCDGNKKNDSVDAGVPGRPQIHLVQPVKAVPGDTITLTGINFGTSLSEITVSFDNQNAVIAAANNDKMQVIVPPPAESEEVMIRVKVNDSPSNRFKFTIDYPQPQILSYPSQATERDTIELVGSGFGSKKQNVNVTFDNTAATIISVEEHLITLVVPDYAGKKNADIKVTVREKTAVSRPFKYINIMYSNPVADRSLPDPTIIKAPDGWFYLYATEDTRNIPVMRSENLTHWTFAGTAFTDATRPNFEPNGGLWAPDVNYINGKYVLYYSMSVWGGELTCGIGVAVADNPAGPFTDKGKLFRSNEIGVQNSIDPCFVEDNGKKYLMWGSFRGIYMTELSEDGLSLKEGAEKQQVAGTYFEGVYIHKKDNYYYMFASIGSCCDGINSTYQLVVGRSSDLRGPYVNKSGTPMLSNGYTLVINKNGSFVGNGHCSQIVQDKNGNDWLLYHGIRTSNASGRVLMLDQIRWDEQGWPYIAGGSPSLKAPAPVFD